MSERTELLERLRERIFAFAASRLGKDFADDVAQETLMVIHEKYAHLTAIEDLLPVALQTARFKMNGARRKMVRHGEFTAVAADGIPLADGLPGQDEVLERKQMRERMARAIAQLGERCRKILAWKLAGHGFGEIQRLLGVESINTVYTWDHRCRKDLLELMGGAWEAKSGSGGGKVVRQ